MFLCSAGEPIGGQKKSMTLQYSTCRFIYTYSYLLYEALILRYWLLTFKGTVGHSLQNIQMIQEEIDRVEKCSFMVIDGLTDM